MRTRQAPARGAVKLIQSGMVCYIDQQNKHEHMHKQYIDIHIHACKRARMHPRMHARTDIGTNTAFPATSEPTNIEFLTSHAVSHPTFIPSSKMGAGHKRGYKD